MSKQRGFTLVELMIVLGVMVILMSSFYTSFVMLNWERANAQAQVKARAEARGAAAKILGRVAKSKTYELQDNNHTIRYGDGSRVVWQDQVLWWERADGRSPLTSLPVLDFVAIERGGELTLTLVLEIPAQTDRLQTYRGSWSYP